MVEITSGDGGAPAAVGPWPYVVQIAAANVAEAGAKTHDMRDARDEGMAVNEAADLEGKMEKWGLELRGGRGW